MDFTKSKARADDGGADDDLGTFLPIVYSSTGCRRATTGAKDYFASSVADFVKNLFVGKSRLRCYSEPSIIVVAEEVKAKMPGTSGGGDFTATQLSEQLMTLRYDTQTRYNSKIKPNSAIWPWMVRYSGFCVTRYARGAGGITPFRAAYDRDLTQETVPFADTILLNILAQEHRGLSSGKRLHKGDTAWDRGIWLGKSVTTPEHIVWPKNGAMGTRTIRRLEPTKRSEHSLLLEVQGVPWDRVVGDARNT